MMRWSWLVVLLVSVVVVQASEPPVQPGRLIGKWKDASGDWALELRADRVVFLDIAPAREKPAASPEAAEKNKANVNGHNAKEQPGAKANGKPVESRTGAFEVRRGLWIVSLRDVDDRAYHYSVVSHDADRFALIDGTGKRIEFRRTK